MYLRKYKLKPKPNNLTFGRYKIKPRKFTILLSLYFKLSFRKLCTHLDELDEWFF